MTAFRARLAKDAQIVGAPSPRSTVGCGNVDISSNRALSDPNGLLFEPPLAQRALDLNRLTVAMRSCRLSGASCRDGSLQSMQNRPEADIHNTTKQKVPYNAFFAKTAAHSIYFPVAGIIRPLCKSCFACG